MPFRIIRQTKKPIGFDSVPSFTFGRECRLDASEFFVSSALSALHNAIHRSNLGDTQQIPANFGRAARHRG
jgi:hypothetical protein